MIKDLKKLHCERSWFVAVFSPLSREMIDVEANRPSLFFKMSMGGKIQLFEDKSRARLLIELRKPSVMGFTWDIFDTDGQDKKLATIHWEMMKSAMKFGAENWTINGPDGGVFLALETEGDSAAKMLLDNMSGLYNPTHKYVLKATDGKLVATFAIKHGLFKAYYDFSFEGGTEDQKKVALAVFAAIIAMLRK